MPEDQAPYQAALETGAKPPLRFCKDCRWYAEHPRSPGPATALCTSPRAALGPVIDLVSGEAEPRITFCSAARAYSGPNDVAVASRYCGTAGQWWEPRP